MKSKRVVRYHPKYIKKMRGGLRELTGKPVRFKRKLLDELAPKTYALEQSFHQFASVPSTLSTAEKKDDINRLFKGMVKNLLGIETDKPLDLVIKGIIDFLNSPDTKGFLRKNTKLRMYIKYLSRIAERIFLSNKLQDIRQYFESATKEDIIILGQHRFELPTESKKIIKEYKNITFPVLKKHIDVYKSLSEFMEKMIFQLYSILKILHGETIDYYKVKEYPLSCNYNYLQGDRDFRLLVKPLDVFIRNSLAHRQRYYSVEKNSLIFKDIKNPKKRKRIDKRKFIQMTRELYSATFVVAHMESVMNICKLKTFKEELRKLQS